MTTSHHLSRKTFLRASGLGAGATFATAIGAPTIGPVAAAHAAPDSAASETGSTGGPILADDRFPIGIFWPPPPLQTTVERYQEIADAGFTFVHGGNYTYADVHINHHQLAVAEQAGLHVLVDDPDIRWLLRQFAFGDPAQPFTLSEDEARQKVAEVVGRYAPQWQLQQGRLLITGGSGNGSIGWVSDGTDWDDYTFAFTTQPRPTGAGGHAQAGWAFRVQDEANAYVWLLSSQGSDGNAALTKAVFVGGTPTVTSTPLPFPLTEGQTYQVETTLDGATITTTIDGEVVDTTTDRTFTSGSAGFRQAGSESAFFDEVRVTAPDGSELFGEDFETDLSAWRRPAGSGRTSFAGLHLFDEPRETKFAQLATAVAAANQAYPDALHYLNHFPNGVPEFRDGGAYERAAEQIDTPVLSFDRYPILADGEDLGYFENLAQVRIAALDHGREPWVYIQSVGYAGHDVPTEDDLRWQISISLAYGYKGVQYFTYWTPDPARGEGFHEGLITVEGRQTGLYRAAARVNTEYLAPLGAQLRPLTSTAVQVAGVDEAPAGLDPFEPDEDLTAIGGDGVVLGRFTGPEDRRYVLVANFSRHVRADVELSLGTGAESFDLRRGEYRAMSSGVLRLDAGAATLIRFG
ncbi:hypothetical protein [Ruania alba]|uniref:Glycoside hydrolase family 42 N-terminal domain-containing protein n=1 Tax=Ruania alba TaxID=648782 RepID=A0A1H5HHL4_9MICO|nr:hypothetical protein [Ruania alba]SEE27447.1 hypothetical protein SAMN04488554_1962 [Ruania alba]